VARASVRAIEATKGKDIEDVDLGGDMTSASRALGGGASSSFDGVAGGGGCPSSSAHASCCALPSVTRGSNSLRSAVVTDSACGCASSAGGLAGTTFSSCHGLLEPSGADMG